jgi:2-keto-4-pentenoate hydratase/2-oxohepta-3-ene-1,7-dioic acid hydratase in catechol pathway
LRLASFQSAGRAGYGLVLESGIVDLRPRLEATPDLRSLLAGGVERASAFLSERPDLGLDAVAWRAVIPEPSQIYCIGLNYRAHAAEVSRPVGDRPVVFVRVAASQTGHGAPIIRPRVSRQLDYEGELAVIIGRAGRHITQADALDHIAGYSIYNDASVRDWQRHTTQYTPGKNFPATGAFGPWMVTSDEIIDPARLELTTRLNGEVVQHTSTSDMIFSIPEIVAYLSTFSELRPGDVIITGTPSGVGSMRDPPLWLAPGDIVEVEIPGIGTLMNSVADEGQPAV